ncbi:MAG: hypothetical protein P8Y07_02335 [Gemmatimonadales bacterium]|jgi:hypothetical protein
MMTFLARNARLLAGALLLAVLAAVTISVVGRGSGDSGIPADSAPEARALLAECGDLAGQEKIDCYQSGLTVELQRVGVRPTMTMLDDLALLDGDVSRDAHVYAHHVGIEAYRMSPDVTETFSSCTESFSSGCYHGVIQAYFNDRGSADAETVEALCEPYRDDEQGRWILFQCIHGMGHGLTMFFGHHLPRALEACDLLGDNWDRQSCYGGAFMENVMAATMPHHPATMLASARDEEDASSDSVNTAAGHGHGEGRLAGEKPWKAVDPADPLYPCSVMAERYQHQCYLMQTSVMLWLNGNDLVAASRSCDVAPPRMRSTCHQSLGRDITARTKDPKEAERDCRAGSEPYRGWCYVGVVKGFVDWTSDAESGLTFCRVVDDPGHKAMCYRGLGEEIATLVADDETRANLCAEAEEEYVESCRRGARLPA